jgi:hypothetical protein
MVVKKGFFKFYLFSHINETSINSCRNAQIMTHKQLKIHWKKEIFLRRSLICIFELEFLQYTLNKFISSIQTIIHKSKKKCISFQSINQTLKLKFYSNFDCKIQNTEAVAADRSCVYTRQGLCNGAKSLLFFPPFVVLFLPFLPPLSSLFTLHLFPSSFLSPFFFPFSLLLLSSFK